MLIIRHTNQIKPMAIYFIPNIRCNKIYRKNLLRWKWKKKPIPIHNFIANNWIKFIIIYFKFDLMKLCVQKRALSDLR